MIKFKLPKWHSLAWKLGKDAHNVPGRANRVASCTTWRPELPVRGRGPSSPPGSFQAYPGEKGHLLPHSMPRSAPYSSFHPTAYAMGFAEVQKCEGVLRAGWGVGLCFVHPSILYSWECLDDTDSFSILGQSLHGLALQYLEHLLVHDQKCREGWHKGLWSPP
jgi:hypothetical protein